MNPPCVSALQELELPHTARNLSPLVLMFVLQRLYEKKTREGRNKRVTKKERDMRAEKVVRNGF